MNVNMDTLFLLTVIALVFAFVAFAAARRGLKGADRDFLAGLLLLLERLSPEERAKFTESMAQVVRKTGITLREAANGFSEIAAVSESEDQS